MSDFSHAVIGGGVVGLAIASRLARRYGPRVILLEKNAETGQETSSRNSEVIHAGIYHPADSLRTKLCIRGRELTYALAKKRNLPVKNCGKWVIAQDDEQLAVLEVMKKRSEVTGVPLNWLDLDKAKELEPAIIARKAILESPTTGIMSAHAFMDYHIAKIQSYDGELVTHTKVTGVSKEAEGYKLTCETPDGITEITADAVVNSAGLYAADVSNMLLPKDRQLKAYYGKGSYFSYAPSQPKVSRLIYPTPISSVALGTHLTIDLAGQLRFGPDLEWVGSPTDLQASTQNLEQAKKDITEYIDLDLDALTPDYAGIRPKTTDSQEFQDFTIRQEKGFPGFINLLNVESPGLTSSMAIAEYVEDLVA